MLGFISLALGGASVGVDAYNGDHFNSSNAAGAGVGGALEYLSGNAQSFVPSRYRVATAIAFDAAGQVSNLLFNIAAENEAGNDKKNP